jgi:putative acetyltransferase
MSLIIRRATDTDLPAILSIHRSAFPDEGSVADLTAALLCDPSAKPDLSLVALVDDKPVGHILFTAAYLQPGTAHRFSLLAPLAVTPERQRQGIGGRLIAEGLAILAQSGVSAVFVLGHPAYYPRFGFMPAGGLGFAAPYPIPAKNADAWLVLVLEGELSKPCGGKVRCARALDRPELWRESVADPSFKPTDLGRF